MIDRDDGKPDPTEDATRAARGPGSVLERDDSPERFRAGRRTGALGWTGLAVWAAVGLALEAAHGLKLAAYLDDPLTRLLLTLAHAHGALLSIVLVLFAAHGAPLVPREDGLTVRLLVGGWLGVPLGFALGAVAHPESDPGLGVWLVPPAALAWTAGLVRVARAAWRRR
ncbi:MAG: hypothetical protein OHK0013_25720 [Sandaracinaceae bacterium]